MPSLFKSDAARATVRDWYERFHAQLTVPTERRTLATSFGETHLLVAGPPAGPPVVLLHGALASSAHLLGELSGLAARHRVYAVDVIGQSVMSADTRLSVKNADYGKWLVEVLDALGLERPLVVGVSWGGFVALRLAAVAPARVSRLALLVPAGLVKGPALKGFLEVGWPMTRYLMAPSPERLTRFLRGLLTTVDDPLWGPYLGDAFRSYDLAISVPALATEAELAALTVPAYVVGAEHDFSFPGAAVLARAAQVLPGLTKTSLLRGCRHSPPTTAAFRAWMSAQLLEFFDSPATTRGLRADWPTAE